MEQTNGSTNPVRSSLLADSSLNEAYPWFSVMNDIATKEGHTFAYPKTTQCTSIMEILAGHVQNAVIGAESVDGALSKAKRKLKTCYNRKKEAAGICSERHFRRLLVC